jgi:RNA polymerase sigma factor (TIGR02999 family)
MPRCSWKDWSCRPSSRLYAGAVNELTHILARVDQGDPKAAAELLPLVYEELRRLAAQKMAHEAAGQTLQPTALVHEAWLRLAGSHHQSWNSRGHFFSAAAEAMRRILIDKARRKNRLRHGQGLARVDLDRVDVAIHSDDDTLLRVDEALQKLAQEEPVKVELVKLRFFIGLSIAQAGQSLGLSESTAKRYWAYARAWLYEELRGDSS